MKIISYEMEDINNEIEIIPIADSHITKYDNGHTKQVKLKLNLETDKAILEKLENVDNIQGYIKDLILRDIEKTH